MANLLHDMTVDGDLVFYEQQDQDPTDGGLWLLLAYTTEAYFVNGVLDLATESATFLWVDQLMELFNMMLEHEERLVYMQHDTYANAWVYMDAPFIKKFTGQNEALTRVYLLIFGTTVDYSWAFQITSVDEVSSDWGI